MHTPPIAWSHICILKNKGDLGVRSSSVFNKAALAKLGWKVLTKPLNWYIKIVSAKYLRKASFFIAKKTRCFSMAWKCISGIFLIILFLDIVLGI